MLAPVDIDMHKRSEFSLRTGARTPLGMPGHERMGSSTLPGEVGWAVCEVMKSCVGNGLLAALLSKVGLDGTLGSLLLLFLHFHSSLEAREAFFHTQNRL